MQAVLPASSVSSAEEFVEPHQVGLDYLASLPGNLDDEGAIRRTALAQLEQQGLLAPGTVDALAAAAVSNALAPPTRVLHDYRLACDINGDNRTETIRSDVSLDTGRSDIYMFNGADGRPLWGAPNLYYFSLSTIFQGYPPRAGMPQPQFGNNFDDTVDLNGDGICDFVAYSLDWTVLPDPVGSAIIFDVHIHAINGRTGADIWDVPLTGAFVGHQVPLQVAQADQFEVINFPTGFVAVNSPSGPKVVVKTTDITYYDVIIADPVNRRYQDYRVTDHVHYLDARSQAKGATVWRHDIVGEEHAARTNFTWISGVAQLLGDLEPEIVLDEFWQTNPRANVEDNNPVTGQPMYRHGKGVSLLALDGATGNEVWNTGIVTETPGRVNLESEEAFESIVRSHGEVLPDITGDGIADVVVTYLTIELNDATTSNGRLRTHVVPVNGAIGAKLWEGDHKYRGWGFVAAMSAGPEAVPYLAFGSTDIAVPGEVPPGGRYPPKFVQLRVLRAEDGVPAWTPYEERWSQDGPLSYHLSLFQFLTTLAPHDWNGDGVLDLVTPARYVRPASTAQTLLSTAKHEYQILSGVDGEVLQTVTAWGGLGMVVACPGAEDQLTILSGHARRLDLSRHDGATGERVWRHPIYNDARIQGSTVGSDIIFLRAVCAEAGAPDNRTMFASNFWRQSTSRGNEIQPLHGYLYDSGPMHWVSPIVEPNPGILNFVEMLPEPVVAASSSDHAIANATPLVFGILAGVGAGLLRNRARAPKDELELLP